MLADWSATHTAHVHGVSAAAAGAQIAFRLACRCGARLRHSALRLYAVTNKLTHHSSSAKGDTCTVLHAAAAAHT